MIRDLQKHPPKKLRVVSDGNEIEFVKIIKTKSETIYEYQFTKSETKDGMLMTFSESELESVLRKKNI